MKKKYESKLGDIGGRIQYSQTENETWDFLVKRQNKLIQTRGCKEFLHGVDLLNFSSEVPQHFEISEVLRSKTGWAVEPVPAIIPAEEFFKLLSEKKFPCANFIRTPEDIDYLEEPDIFHEVYGHCPLLTNQPYADFMQDYGKLALKVSGKLRMRLFRLFWFTIEFGLLKEKDSYKAYGGGILSSATETVYAIDQDKSEKIMLDDPLVALRTPYKIDILQPIYFVLNDIEDLFGLFKHDLIALAEKSLEIGNLPAKFNK
jgi:phenylalanine-4-hydroxylase